MTIARREHLDRSLAHRLRMQRAPDEREPHSPLGVLLAEEWRVTSPTSQANERALKASHLFLRADDSFVASLAQTAVRKSLARGDFLWRAGAPATHFAIIASGLMKISRHSADGTDAIVAIFGPRESIGDVAVVRRTAYPANAIASSSAVEIILVDAAPVLSAMQSNTAIAEAINTSLLEHMQALQEKIKIMTAGAVPQRLATLLLHLAERFGDELDDGSTFIPIVLSRIELSRLIGTTVETTIRAMSRWQRQGWIETTQEGFKLGSVDPLTRLTSGAEAELHE